VRKVNPQTDRLTTSAGNGSEAPYVGNHGPATHASLGACAVAVDHSGNLVIGDPASNRIRVVAASTATFYGLAMKAGHIYAVAGDGKRKFSGDGGPAIQAGLDPQWVAVDAAGNVLIADSNNNRIRVVAASSGTFYGQAMTAGDVYTVAGSNRQGFSGMGGPGTKARLYLPQAVAGEPSGDLLIPSDGRILEVSG